MKGFLRLFAKWVKNQSSWPKEVVLTKESVVHPVVVSIPRILMDRTK
jgi:hypothetical protein